MATYGQTLRRGLPRRPGGEPWPQGDSAAPASDSDESPTDAAPAVAASTPVAGAPPAEVAPVTLPAAVPAASVNAGAIAPPARADGEGVPTEPASPAARGGARQIRRGLPRTPGGEPWPPVGAAPAASAPAGAAVAEAAPAAPAPAREVETAPPAPAAAPTTTTPAPVTPAASTPSAAQAPASEGRPLRRGLPRMPGGEPWPPAGIAPERPQVAAAVASTAVTREDLPPRAESPDQAAPEVAVAAASAPAHAQELSPSQAEAPGTDLSVPLPFTRTVWPGAAAETHPEPAREPQRIGPFTRLQWAGAVIVGGAGLLFAAAMAVLAVRFLLSTEPFEQFLAAYPGEYELPEGAPVGIPPWLGWQHFFNTFLMVLIIRTGLQVRTEKRPSVFWSPRGNPKRKISLALWFHQSLDILWIVNGVLFVVLLFATGQWMKLVPTSWAVFPNAISAALQYVSLDWPTENGWVNYNSLQQLAYFATVFLAAPLAIVTGVRMSGVWPKNAKALNKAYPVEWARAVHFPVMLYFVAFIFVHVALVLATGALRNLNHMYASQDAVNWVGFWIFAASLVVIAAAWVAARPLVLAPIARLFGKVSGR
jgi:thiosulfate reductase cytochrome b subunit